jgi:hypothetical protein
MIKKNKTKTKGGKRATKTRYGENGSLNHGWLEDLAWSWVLFESDWSLGTMIRLEFYEHEDLRRMKERLTAWPGPFSHPAGVVIE